MLVWVQTVAILLILTFVFHFYTCMAAFTRWPPSFLDALLPFLVGGLEVPPAVFLGTEARWCVSVAVLCILCAFGLWTTGVSAVEDNFRNDRAFRQFRDVLWRTAMTALILAGALLIASQIVWRNIGSAYAATLGAGALVIFAVMTLAVLMEYGLREIYHAYNVPRVFFL